MIKEILIIDDSEEIIDVVIDFCEVYGIAKSRIHSSTDPFEGLEIFRKNSSKINFVICDYYLPKSNGPELCEILKSNNNSIFIAIQTGDNNIKLSDLTNVDYILHKPYDYQQFEEMLDIQNQSPITPNNPPIQERAHTREVGGKFSVGIIKIDESTYIHGAIDEQSPAGVGLSITTGSKLQKDQKIEIILAEYKSKSNQYQMQRPRQAKIAWIRLITINCFKVGIKYQE